MLARRLWGPLYLSCALALLGGCADEEAPPRDRGPVLQGRFVDSPVQGAEFATRSRAGLLQRQGEFSYRAGEDVRFEIGDIELGQARAAAVLMPADIIAPARAATNVARLLQTLDEDCDSSNGILVTAQARAAGAGRQLDFDQGADAFAQDPEVVAFLQAAGAGCGQMVSEQDAQAEMDRTQAYRETHQGRPNMLPTADAGADRSVNEGASVQLDGSGSSDPDGQIVGWQWQQLGGPQVALAGADTATPSFTAPDVDADTTLRFRLRVRDDGHGTDTDEVLVTVRAVAGNAAPVADAGEDRQVKEGERVTLDGSGSHDPEDGTTGLSYEWEAPQGITLDDADTAQPGFTAPQVDGEDLVLTFTLRVRDAQGQRSAPDSVVVTVKDRLAPTADAGADQEVEEGTAVALDGSGSADADGEIVGYAWQQIAGPAVTLSNANAAQPAFTAPDVAGDAELEFELTVTDDDGLTGSDRVIVTVADRTVVSIADASATEGADGTTTPMTFTVTVSPPQSQDVSVTWRTANGTARAGSDYVGVADGALTIPAGETSATLAVTVNGDGFDENDETFTVELTQVQGAGRGDTLATGTIRDDDDKGLLRIGAARRSVTPAQQHIDGVAEPRLDGTTRLQRFNLGGFGVNPTQNLPGDPFGGMQMFGEALTEPASQRVFSGSRGPEDTHVRVMVMEQADNTRVAFVMVDAVGAGNLIQKGVKEAINAAACAEGACLAPSGTPGEQIGNIVFGQTHTHAGADLQGLWGGVPQDWVRNVLYPQAADAAREAIRARRPANLTFQQGQSVDFNSYRRPRYDLTADADGTLTLVKAVGDDGTPVGSILQYNAHPTSIDEDPRIPHADYIQGAMDWLESSTTGMGGVALYYNGPIADASGSGERAGCQKVASDADYGNVRCRGEGMASAAQQFAERPLDGTIAARHVEVTLPITNAGFVALGLAGSFNRYYDFLMLPAEQIPGIGPLVQQRMVNLPQLTPVARTLVSRITVGGAENGLEIVTIPGEATNTFGQYIRGLTDNPNMMLLGLTQNSFGYIIPEEEFNYIDPSGDAGLVAPFTGYEENVSLGPLTAPLLRFEGYHPLFDIGPDDPRNLPPVLLACADDPMSEACVLNNIGARIDYIQRAYADQCRGFGGEAAEPFCALFDPDTPLYDMCKDAGLPEETCRALGAPGGDGGNPAAGVVEDVAAGCHDMADGTPFEALCGALDAVADAVGGGGGPSGDQALVLAAAEAQVKGCDVLDTANCLYPFPNDWFTAQAAPGSVQSQARGGTGRRVNFNVAAMPRNTAGKPVDPTEWNRHDGFSPGALIATYVPGLSLEQTYGLPSHEVGLANIGLSQDPDSPILVLEASDSLFGAPARHLVWAEIDQNANQLTIAGAPFAGTQEIPGVTNSRGHVARPGNDGKAALLIRPAKNFAEGKRYVVVLRKLKDAAGNPIARQAGFDACVRGDSALPPVQARCAQIEDKVFPVLADAGIPLDDVYLAWDFTVQSTNNAIGRLRHMRDDAFASLSSDPAGEDCTQLTAANAATCAAPEVKVLHVRENPQGGIARRIEGTITVPSYLVPFEPAPGDDAPVTGATHDFCDASGQAEECDDQRREFVDLAQGATAPNRLFYSPADGTPAPDPGNPLDPTGLRWGDGLPDSTGSMEARFLCQISAKATPDTPARASLYGHGQLDRGIAITYEGVPEQTRDHNYMFCAVDWFGFRTGDAVNVLTALVDLSNFQVVPDASQQGMLNMMFLARAMAHPRGFGALPEFQDPASGRPLFDRSEIFYDGNSQGGIFGGVVLAASKDVNRGVLGALGMNYSTLLTRSANFDEYAGVLYNSYTDPLDRQLLFSMVQMLWDRGENNGYASHLHDNSAFGGPANAVMLAPAFGDPQVSMWTADIMARTMGDVPVDMQQTLHVEALGTEPPGPNGRRHPDVVPYYGLAAMDYSNPAHTGGSVLQVWDNAQLKGKYAFVPPITNTPPYATKEDNRDPHDTSQRTDDGRCVHAHFMRSGGQVIDAMPLVYGTAGCPQIPPATPTVAPGSDPGPAPGFFEQLAAALGDWLGALQAAFNQAIGGDPAGALASLLGATGDLVAGIYQGGSQEIGAGAGVSLPPPGPQTVVNPPPQPLQAGVARRAIAVPVGVPLGGYLRPPVGGEYIGADPAGELTDNIPVLPDGCDQAHPETCQPLAPLPDELRTIHSPYATWFPPSRGYYDSLVAKAVALHDGHDYIVFVKLDFIGMLDEVVQAVKEEVKARTNIDLGAGLIMSATHTHDGPGALANHSTRYFWLAMDAYQPELFERLVPQVADLVVAALGNLQPARFGHALGQEEDGASTGRTVNSFRNGHESNVGIRAENDAVRRRLGVLRVDALDGTPLALLMNYAAHGIAFGVENLFFSGDVLGAAEREVEQTFPVPVVAMLVQNTGGNVSPRADGGPTLQRMERFGKLLAPQVRAVYDGIAVFDAQPDLRAVSQRIVLNRDTIGYPDTDGRNGDGDYPYPWGAAQCNGAPVAVPSQSPVDCIVAPPPDPQDLADNGVAENGAFVPGDTIMTAARIGDAMILAQPGEPLTEYGVRLLKAAAAESLDPSKVYIWGYAQDHIGYLLADDRPDWERGQTEGTTTFWGWKLGDRLLKANVALMQALRDGTAAPADEFQVNYFYRDLYRNTPRPPVTPSLVPGAAIAQPRDIRRFEATRFVFEGGDPVLDLPQVTMLHADGTPVRRANGEVLDTFFEMHLEYRLVSGQHLWTVEFEAPKDWAAGAYRFRVSGRASRGTEAPYQLESANFTVTPAETLQAQNLSCASGTCSVRLGYTPVPGNYRLVDARVGSGDSAPVRTGSVTFSNGTDTVVVPADGSGNFAATIGGSVTVSGVDAWGNRTPQSGGPPPPDGDGDGVPDDTDQCPTEPGPASNNGCPEQSGGGLPLCEPISGENYCLSDIDEFLPFPVGGTIQGLVDLVYNAVTGGGGKPPSGDQDLVLAAAEAQVKGCDLLDPSHCLLPFPSDHFTVPAAADSPQGVNRGGTGRRINLNPLAMPRNIAGKPIDPTEWNRNDGFSPGQQITTYVPNVATVKDAQGNPTGPVVGAPPITNPGASLDVASSSVVVIDTVTGAPHPVWAEIDLNAGYLLPADKLDNPDPTKDAKPSLIVRPAKNFAEGRRYVVVLKNLKDDDSGATLAAGAVFRACRDNADPADASALPPVQQRCAQLRDKVFPVLTAAGIAVDGNEGLYLAWDFTTASTENNVARLRHMRDDAFINYLQQEEDGAGNIVNLGRAPQFTVTQVVEGSGGARTVRGSFTIPSYVLPPDPSPLERERELRQQLKEQFPELAPLLDQFNQVPRQATSISAPPNRLHYLPDASSADVCDPDPGQLAGGCAAQARYGDGLPDRTGEMTATFTCELPRNASATTRPIVYGHGLLGGQEERGADHDYDMMYCKADWFGFAFGDIPNVVSVLFDMSNFPVIPDASQQGMVNQLFFARLLRHPQGFVSHPAFRGAGDTPLFDNREVFYDGNSQGGILGGVVVAMSKDITRGVLGVVGMNYSTLLQRSVDYDGQLEPGIPPYSLPTYLGYQDDLDRQLVFSIIQMLWDRSENNGYAHHITDNSALHGPDNQALLHPAFADHQVTHWSAHVMGRTVGVEVADLYVRKPGECFGDVTQCFADKWGFFADRDPDDPDFWGLPLVGRDAGAAYDSAGCSGTACRTRTSGLVEFDEGKTAVPPIGNVPPRADGHDPHEYPRGTSFGRCQKSHFLHTQGRLIDVRGERNVTSAANCPALPVAVTPPPVPVAGEPGIPPFPVNPCAPDAIPGIGNECLLDAPVAGDLLQGVWSFLNGGDPPGGGELPGGGDLQPVVEQLVANAQTLPADMQASLETLAANAASGALAARDAEVVVMEGRQFPDWSQPAAQGIAMPYPNGAFTGNRDAHAGVMLYPPPGFTGLPTAARVGEIVGYKWTAAGGWEEIPVQVDERFPYFLANPNSDFGIYSGTDMELTYAWDRETWKATGACFVDPTSVLPTPDPVAGLDDDDEVVFMARDAGEFADPALAGPEGTEGGGQEIALADPLDPGTPRFVYLFRKPAGPTFSEYYVTYTRDADADQWIDRSFFEGGPDTDPLGYRRENVGTSNTGYGPNLSGVVCWDGVTPRNSTDRFPRDGMTVSTDKYQVYASGRWMVRDVRVARPGQPRVYGADIVDRWKGRAFQQSPDSTISLVGFEDEQVNWEANSALLGERVGPVRAIREVWGADSGTNVTKTETYYSDAYVYRYRMRVHPIPPDGIYTSWDYNRGAMVAGAGDDPAKAGRYYTAVRGAGVPIDGINDDVGNVDGVGSTPAYFDMADPTLNLPLGMYNWEQVAAKNDLGSLVYLFELKSATIGPNAAVIPYYRDDACLDDGTGDDPVQRPFPGEGYAWENGRVPATYDALAGRTLDHSGATFADCLQRQGAHAQHGIHMLLPPETDNAFAPVPVDEVDGQQWAFPVPMSEPANVGERYANVVRVPLARAARPRPAGGGGGGVPGTDLGSDYETCVAMARQGGAADHEAAARFSCAVIFGGGRGEGETAEDQIQGPNTYVAMDDGTLIAANVYIPWGCNVAKNPEARPCASILEMSGYESGSDEGQTPAGDMDDILRQETGQGGLPLTGGTRASHEKYYKSGERYVSVTASVRGTGCSAGEFDLFSRKSAMDGYQLVEWMADQPWSNGKVGIFGHSYSGITGAMIASTNPPSLKMVTVSGQIGDVYRDITYPGGVSNYGFPLLWTGGVRPAYDYLGGTFAGLIADSPRSEDDPIGRQCAQNQAARSRTVQDDPLIQGTSETDTPWFQERSVVNYLHAVRAPTQIVTAYQDEQTGPRGGTHVFDRLPQDLTRRLVMLNGDHGSQTGPAEVTAERRWWMDRFMLDGADPNPGRRPRPWAPGTTLPAPAFADDGTATSRVLLEVNAGARSNGHVDSTGFPLAQTQWADFYFRGNHTLTRDTPLPNEASPASTWFNGSKRQFYSYQAGTGTGSQLSTADAGGADELVFALDIDSVAQPYGSAGDTAFVVAGPIMADLYISSTAPDTELMVQLIDADPATGERLYLQRGVLRASHRAVEAQRSQCAYVDDPVHGGGRITHRECTLLDNIYRPYRPHDSSTDLIAPGQVTRYALEIFPVGHVFRAGHQLLVKVHAPSLDDNDWAYISRTPPALNTLHHSAEYASSIRLPVIPVAAVGRLGGPTATCSDDSMRCVIVAGGASLGSDPTGSYREDCHDFGNQWDPTGGVLTGAICGTFDLLAGLLFDDGSGGGEPGPGTAAGEATGQAFDEIAGGTNDAIGSAPEPGATGRVRAGVGVVDMTPDVGYGAGQYSPGNTALVGGLAGGDVDPYAGGKKQEPSYGVQSRLTGRAIVIEGSNGKRIALLKSDNYLAQDYLVRRIAQILAESGSSIGYDQILYGVTHAHSSTYLSSPSWGVWVFQDAFDARFFEFQARKLAAAILEAEADLRPARMGATTVHHKVYKGNVMRPKVADDRTPAGYPREFGDLGLVVMRIDEVDANGGYVAPLAVWMNWGQHPEGLDGYSLHSPDYVGPLERFVDRELGVPLVFSQGDVGSAENSGNESQRIADDGHACAGTGATAPACAAGEGVQRVWQHAGHAQGERGARFLADAVIKGWKVIGGELPPDAPPANGVKPNNHVASVQVPMGTGFPVDYRSAWVPGPLSHPYPGVSACKTENTVEGNPGVPNAAECTNAPNGSPDSRALVFWETLKQHGIPVPEHYELPAYGAVEENQRLRLQAFRVGDVVLGSCACEAQVDLILNFESRANDVEGDIYDGFDWGCLIDGLKDDPQYAAACAVQKKHFDPAEFPYDLAPHAQASNRDPAAIARMRAQVHNDARGWDAPEYAPFANAEPADPRLIKGNFTREELPAALGYKLAVGIGHAGDYNGYTVSYREYMGYDDYRKHLTAYGPHTADYMVTRLVRMAGAMKGAPELAPEPLDALAQADEARQLAASTAFGQATNAAYESFLAMLPPDVGPAGVEGVTGAQPKDIGWFEAATFTWRGGSTAVDNPVVQVQRCGAASLAACTPDQWRFFGDQHGEVQTRVHWPQGVPGLLATYAGRQEWLWSANFEAFEGFPARLGSTPAGFYRFVVAGCINDFSAPDDSVTARLANVLDAAGCRSGATPYTQTSDPFRVVQGARGVTRVTSDGNGNLAITVAARSIPKSYDSEFRFVNDEEDFGTFCLECSFRPWAYSAAAPASVTVTVDGVTYPVSGAGTSWNASVGGGGGRQATITVRYADNRVSRPLSFTLTGAPQAIGDGGGTPPPPGASGAPQLCAPEGTPEIEGECLEDNGGEAVQEAVNEVWGATLGGL
jgi:predicted acyl esterase